MTEGDGGTRKNVRDEMDDAAEDREARRKKDDVKEAGRDTTSDSAGGVKDNVRDDWRKSQER